MREFNSKTESKISENVVKEHYLKKYENRFIAKWSFEGDDNFNKDAQFLFLRTIFRTGVAAVAKSSLAPKEREILIYYPAPLKDDKGEIILSPIGINGVIKAAIGYPAWKNYHNLHLDIMDKQYGIYKRLLSAENTVFFQSFYGEDYIGLRSIKTRLEEFVNQLVEAWARLAELIPVFGGKLVANKNNKIVRSNSLDKFYTRGVLELSVNEASDDDLEDGDLPSELANSVALFKFEDDSVKKQIENITMLEQRIDILFGFRNNQLFKKQRMITSEVDNSTQEFKASEFRIYEALESFCVKYKEVFGAELKVVDNLDSKDKPDVDIIDSEEEQLDEQQLQQQQQSQSETI